MIELPPTWWAAYIFLNGFALVPISIVFVPVGLKLFTVSVKSVDPPKAKVVLLLPKVIVTPVALSSAFILADCSNNKSTLLVPSPI